MCPRRRRARRCDPRSWHRAIRAHSVPEVRPDPRSRHSLSALQPPACRRDRSGGQRTSLGSTRQHGAWIRPDRTFKDCGIPDVICVPDLQVAPGESIAGRFDDAIAWLTQCHQAGATLASACSGTLLLAEAGLLDGCEATTHWAYCEDLTLSYPRIAVRQARCLVT